MSFIDIRVAVIGTIAGGGVDIEMVSLTLSRAAYDNGEHYDTARKMVEDNFESIHACIDENDPGAAKVAWLNGGTPTSIKHWALYTGDEIANQPDPDECFAMSIDDQREANGQLYLQLNAPAAPADNPNKGQLSLIVEVSSCPRTGRSVPCVHLAADGGENTLSVYQSGEGVVVQMAPAIHLAIVEKPPSAEVVYQSKES